MFNIYLYIFTKNETDNRIKVRKDIKRQFI